MSDKYYTFKLLETHILTDMELVKYFIKAVIVLLYIYIIYSYLSTS